MDKFIGTEVHMPDGYRRYFPMPQSDEALDEFFRKEGVQGSRLIGIKADIIKCDYDAVNQCLSTKSGWDIEELNHLAQRLEKLSPYEFTLFDALCREKSLDTPAKMINTLCTLKNYRVQTDMKSPLDIGSEFVRIKMLGPFLHCIDLEAIGRTIVDGEKGKILDSGYCHNFYKEHPIHYEGGMLFYGNNAFEYDGNYSLMVMLSDKNDAEYMRDGPSAWVRLPASDSTIERAVARLGADDGCCMEQVWPKNIIDLDDVTFCDMDIYELNKYVKAQLNGQASGPITPKEMRNRMEDIVRNITDIAYQRTVQGYSGIKEETGKLREIVSELVDLWGINERFVDQFDMDVGDAEEAAEKQGGMIQGM